MAEGFVITEKVKRQLEEMFRSYINRNFWNLLQRKRWFGATVDNKSIICKPVCDVDGGDVAICNVFEGPIGNETATGDSVVCRNGPGAPTIAKAKRCEGIHYSMRRGGEAYRLTEAEVSSLCSVSDIAGLSTGGSISSGHPFHTADYELIPLECS